MKTILTKLAGLPSVGRIFTAGGLKLALVTGFGLVASLAAAQPANDNFANATVISGLSGTINGDNLNATLELPCETNLVQFVPVGNSVWYKWTTTNSGPVALDTIGSAFDTVLSVWTTPTGLCSGSLTNLAVNDDDQVGGNSPQSALTFTAVAGTTYYFCVEGYDYPPVDAGNLVLNWSQAAIVVPTIRSGNFTFTSPSYYVSELDSSSPISQDGNTVGSSVLGARVTVTRNNGSSGRVLVDFYTVNETYTNIFLTNYYGTNVTITFTDTNGVTSTTNTAENFIVYSNYYQSFVGGNYVYYPVGGALTNFITTIYGQISSNTLYGTSFPVVQGPLTPVPTVFPAITNYFTGVTNRIAGVATNITLNNIFSYVTTNDIFGSAGGNGTSYTNNSVVYVNYTNLWLHEAVTNFYGTNTFSSSFLLGGVQLYTNYFRTNFVVNFLNQTNAYYTNGALITNQYLYTSSALGRTNFAWSSSNNAANYNSFGSGQGPLDPVPTNLPPIGTFSLGVTNEVDANSNIIITASSSYRNLPVPVFQVIQASGAFGTVSNTLFFDDYEMSKDIVVPVRQVRSPNGNVLPYISGVVTVKLGNIRLDDQESPDLITPTIGGSGSSRINAFSSQYSQSSSEFGQPSAAGLFNFERSTFRVDKDVPGGVAMVSVYRIGGDPTQGATVDYVIDPTPRLDGGGFPPPTFNSGRVPANTFPLQAGSDYANPDSDYTPVTGTLSWGAFDYNPKTITIPILNNGLVENNADMLIQLYNPLPKPSGTTPGVELGIVNYAYLTVLFDDRTCAQQPAGAVDRCWNKDAASDSVPPYLPYPGTDGGVSGSSTGNGGTVYAVAEQPDGKAIVAGSFISFDSNPYKRIVRLLDTGYQDPTFLVSPNSGANDFISSLALQPDGQILICGKFTSFNGANRYHVARLNADGSVDGSFMNGTLGTGLGVRGTNAMVWSLALQTNGQVVIAGNFTSVNGTNCNSIARLNADGTLDLSFNPGVGPTKLVNDQVVAATISAVVVDSLGRLIIGGEFDSVGGMVRGGVARLNVDGTVDPTFDPGIGTFNPDTGFTDPVYALALQPDGALLVGGGFSYYELATYNGILRLSADGSVDTSFNSGTGTYNPATEMVDTVTAITLQPDGTILIGGDFTTYNQTRRVGIARLFSYGSLDTSFMDTYYNQFAGLVAHYHNPDAVNPALYPQGNHRGFVNAIAVEPGTTNVIIGGNFSRVGGGFTRRDIHPRSNIARLIGGGTPGPGNIQFAYGKYTVDKSGGTLFVSLIRTNGDLGPISVTLSTNTAAPGPGIATGDDFSILPVYTTPVWATLWSANPGWSWMISPAFYGPNYRTLPNSLPLQTDPFVYIDIHNNTNISGDVNANLALINPDGSSFTLGGEKIPLGTALGFQDAAPMTIIDNNYKPGVLGLSSATYPVNQNAGTVTITVNRTNFTGGVVQVSYMTVNGTATNGIDYTNTTGTLTFQTSDSSKTFTIPIIRGTTTQPDRTFNVWLHTPAGGATLGTTNAVVTIVNNNGKNGHLGFVSATNSFNEDSGTALVGISRLGNSQGSLSVTVITSDGTATNGLNYAGTVTNLSWANGDVATKFVSVPLQHDGVFTPDLTVNLRLTNGVLNSVTNNAVVLGFGGTNTILSIVNVDFPGTVQFSTDAYAVKKYGGFALIPVVRTGGNSGTVTVNYTTADLSALAGVNYTASAGLLTFTNGEVTKYFNVPIMPDASSGPVALNLILTNAVVVGNATPWNALGSPSNALLNIINTTLTDPLGVNETPGAPDVTYSPFPFAGFNDAIFALALQADNQLIVGGDFTMANGVRRQHIARLDANGALDAAFSMPISTMGADGSVRALAVQTDGRILVGGYFTNMNNVVMNRIARLNHDGSLDSLFNPGSGADNPVYAVAETFVSGERKILVAGDFSLLNGEIVNGFGRLNDDGTPDLSFNVGGLGADSTVYAMVVQPDGKVLIGGDFTAVNGVLASHIARLNADGSVDMTFTNASANDSVRAITIQPDGQILIGGLFTSVNGNTGFNHIARLNSANGSTDSTFTPGLGADAAVLSIAVQTDSRIVVGGLFSHCSGVSRNRITRLNPDGTVDPTINFGAGADSFVGAVVIQEATIAGYPTNVPNEKIIIGGGFTHYFGEPHKHLARIYGGSIGGSGEFEFSSATYGVNENGTNAVITVNRTGGTSGTNANGLGNTLVTFATADGTAVADTDHASVTNYFRVLTNLVFAAGEVQQTVSVRVRDDQVVTPDLTVNLALTPLAPAQPGNQPNATLFITNVDSAISFSAATYLTTKYGANVPNGFAPITINRSGATKGTSTVIFNTTSNGTAIADVDYTPQTNLLVTFLPGVSVQTVMIPIINGVSDGDRTVSLQLTNVTGSLTYNPSNALLTILDRTQSKGGFQFSATNYLVTEGGGIGFTNVTITVLRTNGAAGIVSVGYATADGTAVAGAKYVTKTGVLTFADGEMVKTFDVPVVNTPTVEPTSYFSVLLTNASIGTSIFSPSNATVTILNTNIGIAFALATNTFSETLPFATINVLRYNNTVGTTTINYATTNGTALAGVNYLATSGTLTFNDGAAQAAILVPLIYNTAASGDVQFTIGLSHPLPGVQLGNPSQTTVILQDADTGLSFTTNHVRVLKNGGNLVVTVLCSNTNVEPVSVDYATADGTAADHATAGSDYVAVSGTLTFSNGVSSLTFTVPIINNGAVSGDHTFTVSLSKPTGTGRLVSPSVQTVTIIDSNSGIRFSAANYTVLKTGGAALISVTRSDFTNTLSTVDFIATNGTAINGLNFVATNGTLVFTNGQLTATFSVPIIATTTVQPDLTVLLELRNAVNGVLIAPSAATLTIHDNTGSYVIPAGAQLVSESGTANGIIDPNETVTVLFGLRDAGGTNVNNLIATLQSTAGVTPVNPVTANYGPLVYASHSVSRPFTFTAHGTNNQQIAATFKLQDGANNIGTAIFGFTLGSWTTTFANTNPIVINDNTNAAPYPALINVSGVGGSLVKATVTLTNLSHTAPADIAALVANPGGSNTLIMANAGATFGISHVTLTFDDAAATNLPTAGQIISGTNKPSGNLPVKSFP